MGRLYSLVPAMSRGWSRSSSQPIGWRSVATPLIGLGDFGCCPSSSILVLMILGFESSGEEAERRSVSKKRILKENLR